MFKVFRIFIANGTESIFFMSISNIVLSGGSLWQFLCATNMLLQVILVARIQMSFSAAID